MADGRRRAGLALMVVGAVVAVVGLAGALGDDDGDGDISASADATTTTVDDTTTASPESTTSSSSIEATDAPAQADEGLDEFVAAFNVGATSGDLDFAFDRLHPAVIARYSADGCRDFLESRFDGTTIEVVGEPSAPRSQTFETPEGDFEVTGFFAVPVELTFQGRVVPTDASFAPIDGLLRWFTNCEG